MLQPKNVCFNGPKQTRHAWIAWVALNGIPMTRFSDSEGLSSLTSGDKSEKWVTAGYEAVAVAIYSVYLHQEWNSEFYICRWPLTTLRLGSNTYSLSDMYWCPQGGVRLLAPPPTGAVWEGSEIVLFALVSDACSGLGLQGQQENH